MLGAQPESLLHFLRLLNEFPQRIIFVADTSSFPGRCVQSASKHHEHPKKFNVGSGKRNTDFDCR